MSELLRMEHYTFRYPQQRRAALDDVSLRVEQGAFMVLCGPSGCGKSTLLRQLKTVLAPHGAREGAIFFDGRPLADVSEREQASGIGFVQQSVDKQTVTDKVWHELAFGLESLGLTRRPSAAAWRRWRAFSAFRTGFTARWRAFPADRSSF